jgi:hypothetical protein
VKIARHMASKFYHDFVPICGYMASGVPPADQPSRRLKSGQFNLKRN